MFMVALFIVAKTGTLRCPSTGEWINKLWYIHTVEYYSVTKRDRFLIPATTWMGFKCIMLIEASQTPKSIYCMIPLIRHLGKL